MAYYYRAGKIYSMVTEYQQPLEYQPQHLRGHRDGSHTPPPGRVGVREGLGEKGHPLTESVISISLHIEISEERLVLQAQDHFVLP